jgi:hypothetical protein
MFERDPHWSAAVRALHTAGDGQGGVKISTSGIGGRAEGGAISVPWDDEAAFTPDYSYCGRRFAVALRPAGVASPVPPIVFLVVLLAIGSASAETLIRRGF